MLEYAQIKEKIQDIEKALREEAETAAADTCQATDAADDYSSVVVAASSATSGSGRNSAANDSKDVEDNEVFDA